MLNKEDLEYFIAQRKRRGLRQADVAKMLGVDRAVIGNVEVGRTKGERTEITAKVAQMIEDWRREDRQNMKLAIVREGGFVPDYVCPACKNYVPGPPHARHCVECGSSLAPRHCRTCRHPVRDPEANFCPKCGGKLD